MSGPQPVSNEDKSSKQHLLWISKLAKFKDNYSSVMWSEIFKNDTCTACN